MVNAMEFEWSNNDNDDTIDPTMHKNFDSNESLIQYRLYNDDEVLEMIGRTCKMIQSLNAPQPHRNVSGPLKIKYNVDTTADSKMASDVNNI